MKRKKILPKSRKTIKPYRSCPAKTGENTGCAPGCLTASISVQVSDAIARMALEGDIIT